MVRKEPNAVRLLAVVEVTGVLFRLRGRHDLPCLVVVHPALHFTLNRQQQLIGLPANTKYFSHVSNKLGELLIHGSLLSLTFPGSVPKGAIADRVGSLENADETLGAY